MPRTRGCRRPKARSPFVEARWHLSIGSVWGRLSLSTPAIELDGIVKTFGRTTALDGLSLTVGRGELVGLLGPNGAGKTTAIKLLLGLARPTRGSGRVLGAPLGDRAARARIGYLPELFRYQPWLTAREVLALHAELARLAASRRARRHR